MKARVRVWASKWKQEDGHGLKGARFHNHRAASEACLREDQGCDSITSATTARAAEWKLLCRIQSSGFYTWVWNNRVFLGSWGCLASKRIKIQSQSRSHQHLNSFYRVQDASIIQRNYQTLGDSGEEKLEHCSKHQQIHEEGSGVKSSSCCGAG